MVVDIKKRETRVHQPRNLQRPPWLPAAGSHSPAAEGKRAPEAVSRNGLWLMAHGLWLTAYGSFEWCGRRSAHSNDSWTVIKKTVKGEVHKGCSAQDSGTVFIS